MTELHWLPALPDWRQRLALPANPATAWDNAVALANARLNFVLTNALDETVRRAAARTGRRRFHQEGPARRPGIVHAGASAARHPRRRPAPRHLDRHI